MKFYLITLINLYNNMTQRYYIAVPKKIKNWGYQTIPSWKNYSFTGTLREAQETAIDLFIQESHLNNPLDELDDYYDEQEYEKICETWEDIDLDKQYEYLKVFYNDYLRFENDEYASGLTLWTNISPDDVKNYYEDEVTFVEL